MLNLVLVGTRAGLSPSSSKVFAYYFNVPQTFLNFLYDELNPVIFFGPDDAVGKKSGRPLHLKSIHLVSGLSS